jgi:predicted negative regulator of RcsB-dependent stress response
MDKDVSVKQTADIYYLAAWLHANKKPVIRIASAVLIVAAIVGGYFWHKYYVETQAADMLSAVRPPSSAQGASPTVADAQPYLKIADDYSGTRAAGRALLLAGGVLFDAGKFDQSQQVFRRFMANYSDSPMANIALLGIAASLEAEGKNPEAATAYEDIIRRPQMDSTTSQAKSALARVDLALNKPDQALHLYEDLLRNNGNDTWSAEAGIQIQELLAKYPALKKTPTLERATAPPTAPPPSANK